VLILDSSVPPYPRDVCAIDKRSMENNTAKCGVSLMNFNHNRQGQLLSCYSEGTYEWPSSSGVTELDKVVL